MSKQSIAVVEWRRRMKKRAVDYLGGKCSRCGYDKCLRALSFHHLNPSQKKFGLSSKTLAWETLEAELKKCILLCCNCHMEEEDRLGCGSIGTAAGR